MVKRFWKPILFVTLNVFIIVWLGIILEMLIRVIIGEDPLALLGILIADVAFLIAGILLVILNRYYHILVANKVIPFIAVITLTLVALLNVNIASLWFGAVIAGALILGCLVTTIGTLMSRKAGEGV
jgi:hypothetical protein